MTLIELKHKLSEIKDLPTLPIIIMKVIDIMNDPKASVGDLKNLIESDYIQALRVLKLANSPYYGFPRKITTISSAIVLLGFNEIKNLLLSATVYNFFKESGREEIPNFNLYKFLDHCTAVATCSRIIGETVGYDKPEELFVGGLLHDIGRVLQYQFFTSDFKKLLQNVLDSDSWIYKKEKRILGYTHNEIGMILAENWQLGEKLIDIIAYHHRPFFSKKFSKEAAIVGIADCMIRSLKIGSAGDYQIPQIEESVFEVAGIKVNNIPDILFEVDKKIEDTKNLFNLE